MYDAQASTKALLLLSCLAHVLLVNNLPDSFPAILLRINGDFSPFSVVLC